jgi:hypothetical protein
MRYLKRQTLDRRSANNTTLYSDAARANVYIAPSGQGSVVIPTGTTAQRPASPVSGMMRYNTDISTGGQIEVYQGGTWRSLRFKEAGQITQQNLGAGDGTTTYFGPLSPQPPTVVANNATWGAQNILVIVENVIQVSGINYTVTNNPTVAAQTYAPRLSFAATVGSTTLYFNSALQVTGASGNGSTATLTFTTQTQVPFAIGATITVTDVVPLAYNGTYTVTASTTSSVSYAAAANTTYQNSGEIVASTAVYPAVSLLGDIVTGTNMATSTTLSSVSVVNTTYQFSCTSTTLAVNQAVTVTGTIGGVTWTSYTSGNTYYIISTNGTTGFTLSATPGGTQVTVTTGSPTGLTFTLPVSVLSYVTDPATDALTSVTISKATITSTIAVNTALTITSGSQAGAGYFLNFSSPVPYGKVVIALIGFDGSIS